MATFSTAPLAEIALNSEPVKYAILALTSPLWIPFFKALWHTLNDGLREEGGLLGHPPNEQQLLELERELGPAAASLISVPKDGPAPAGEPSRSGRPAAPGARGAAGGRTGGGSGRPGRMGGGRAAPGTRNPGASAKGPGAAGGPIASKGSSKGARGSAKPGRASEGGRPQRPGPGPGKRRDGFR